jgi:oligopeptide transport system substrate-binding protein
MAGIRRCFALFFCIALMAAGCGRRQKAPDIFRYDLAAPVVNLDPQFARQPEAKLIIHNCFRALLRIEADGSLAADAAEDYSVSGDGLQYTFRLKTGLLWSDGSPLTANDYQFALQRLFNPSAPSPYAQDFLSIKGAPEILSGTLAVENLGVSAPDDLTLVVQLETPNASFPALMASSASMPCNAQFFAGQKGRYGLAHDSVIYNGAFSVRSWNAQCVSLRQNENHDGRCAYGIDLHIGRGQPSVLFEAGESDFCLLSWEAFDGRQRPPSAKPYYNQVYSLVFNQNRAVYADRRIRTALAGTLETGSIRELLSEDLRPSTGIIPETAWLKGTSYRQIGGDIVPVVFPSNLRGSFYQALSEMELDKLPKSTLYVPDTDTGRRLGGLFQRLWQQQLSCSINIAALPLSQLETLADAGQFEMILLPGQTGLTPEGVLRFYLGGGVGFSDPRLDALLSRAQSANTPEDAASLLNEAEQLIVDSCAALPLFSAPAYFLCDADTNGAVYCPYTGLIDFSGAERS